MAANTDLFHQASTGSLDWLTQRISKAVADIGLRYHRAAGRKVVRALDARQLRDAGIDAVYTARSEEAAARAVSLANLLSLR